jgi:hypothetical protein
VYVQVNISQDGNAILGAPSFALQPWRTALATTGNITASAGITSPLSQNAYDLSIFDGYTGKRWCQATNTVQSSDPGLTVMLMWTSNP